MATKGYAADLLVDATFAAEDLNEARETVAKGDAAPAAEVAGSEVVTGTETKPAQDGKPQAEAEKTEPEGDEEEAEHESGEPRQKRKGGFQKRIERLNARLAQVERERDALAAERAGEPRGPGSAAVERPEAQSSENKPRPDDFDSHEAYVEAVADWAASRRLGELKQEMAKTAAAERLKASQNALQDRVRTFAEDHPDFHDTVKAVDDVEVSLAVRQILTTRASGPALIYELAKNPEELVRISALDPIEAAIEIGKLEGRLAQHAGTTNKTETKPPPPAPIRPVSARTGPPPKADIAKVTDPREFFRLREEQIRNRRR